MSSVVRDGSQPATTEADDIAGIHYQAMTGEDMEGLASAVVRSSACQLARAL
jgi:hypothetical protein